MVVAVERFDLRIPGARSLKQKRHVVKSLTAALRQTFAVSVSEVDHQDLWQRAALGVAVVSAEAGQVAEMLQSVRSLVDGAFEAQLLDWQEQVV